MDVEAQNQLPRETVRYLGGPFAGEEIEIDLHVRQIVWPCECWWHPPMPQGAAPDAVYARDNEGEDFRYIVP